MDKLETVRNAAEQEVSIAYRDANRAKEKLVTAVEKRGFAKGLQRAEKLVKSIREDWMQVTKTVSDEISKGSNYDTREICERAVNTIENLLSAIVNQEEKICWLSQPQCAIVAKSRKKEIDIESIVNKLTDLENKIIKLMVMAQGPGGSPSEWTAGQILYGLDKVASNVTITDITKAIESLGKNGYVKLNRTVGSPPNCHYYVLTGKGSAEALVSKKDLPHRSSNVSTPEKVDEMAVTKKLMKIVDTQNAMINTLVTRVDALTVAVERKIDELPVLGSNEQYIVDLREKKDVDFVDIEENEEKILTTADIDHSLCIYIEEYMNEFSDTGSGTMRAWMMREYIEKTRQNYNKKVAEEEIRKVIDYLIQEGRLEHIPIGSKGTWPKEDRWRLVAKKEAVVEAQETKDAQPQQEK